MLGRFVGAMLLGIVAAPAFAQTPIEQLSPGALVNAKDRIPACQALYPPYTPSRDSSERDCVWFFIKRGADFEEARDFAAAVLLYSEAIRLNTRRDFIEPWRRRGGALEQQGRFDAAMDDYNESIRREPTDAISLTRRGTLHLLKRDLPRAFADLDRAIALDSSQHDAFIARGDAWLRQDEIEKARADYQAVLRMRATDRSRILAQGMATNRIAGLPPPKAAVPAQLNRVALVIGNGDYRHVARLPNPVRDADAVAKTLRQIGFREVVQLSNVGKDAMVEGLRRFAALAEKADWALVYFSGHGMEVAGVNYLVPVDAVLRTDRDIGFEAVALDQVLNVAERAAQLRLVVLDACRDNPFAKQMRRTMTVATRSVARGLASVEPEAGTLVVYAAKDGEVAFDGDGDNSPFTTALLRNISTPGLEVRRLFDFVRDDVMEATQKRQKPFSYGSISGRQDFYFVAKN